MTAKHFLSAIAVATVFTGGAALARTDQWQTAGQQLASVDYRSDARASAADRHSDHRGERRGDMRRHGRTGSAPMLRVVPNRSQPQDQSYGWQYFSNPRALWAVVISPAGEYYLSQGEGPTQVTGPAGQVLVR